MVQAGAPKNSSPVERRLDTWVVIVLRLQQVRLATLPTNSGLWSTPSDTLMSGMVFPQTLRGCVVGYNRCIYKGHK